VNSFDQWILGYIFIQKGGDVAYVDIIDQFYVFDLQYVEYYIDRGVLGVSKEVQHVVFEYKGAPVTAHTRSKWDSQQNLVVSTMPPTLIGVCRLIQIYYVLKVCPLYDESILYSLTNGQANKCSLYN